MLPNDTKNTTTTDPVFVEGVTDRGAQKRVAIAVNVNFELKDGIKEKGHSVPIHHVPLLKRLYPGGTVKVLSHWPRGIARTRELTQEELKKELEGLIRSYGQRMPGSSASIMAEVYGPTETIQLQTLHAKMAAVYHAWAKLEADGKQRLAKSFPGQRFHDLEIHGLLSHVITDAEIAELVKLVEPEREELSEIQLPEITNDGQEGDQPGDGTASDDGKQDDGSNGNAGDDGPLDPVDWLTNEIARLGLNAQDALTVAALCVESGDKDPAANDLKKTKALLTPKGALNAMLVKKLNKLFAEYRQRNAAAAATP